MVDKTALWHTIPGFADDVDGYISEAKFGIKEDYAKAAAATMGEESRAPMMLLLTLHAIDGGYVAQQGYSIGGGWTSEDEGESVEHTSGKVNFVKNSIYGLLIDRVANELGVDMASKGAGDPRIASTWVGLGFHWNQEEHDVVTRKDQAIPSPKKTALMPTSYLGDVDIGELQSVIEQQGSGEPTAQPEPVQATPVKAAAARPAVSARPAVPARPAAPAQAAARPAAVVRPVAKAAVAPAKTVEASDVAPLSAVELSLKRLAKVSKDVGTFQAAAINSAAVKAAQDPEMLVRILDDSSTGLFELLRAQPD